MKLYFTNEQLQQQIEAEPDGMECEAGISPSTSPTGSTADHQIQLDMLMDDKIRLADALKEIYSIRGEDPQIERIVNEALRQGNVVGS